MTHVTRHSSKQNITRAPSQCWQLVTLGGQRDLRRVAGRCSLGSSYVVTSSATTHVTWQSSKQSITRAEPKCWQLVNLGGQRDLRRVAGRCSLGSSYVVTSSATTHVTWQSSKQSITRAEPKCWQLFNLGGQRDLRRVAGRCSLGSSYVVTSSATTHVTWQSSK
jgi:hypothetical protein